MTLSFPKETIERAKEITRLYSQRYPTNLRKAHALYLNNFLELNYGFEDAIKKGVGGQFLHEANIDADCFSLAGIHYIIAKELKLKPKMYWASDMFDLKLGENKDNKNPGEHSFITVQLSGKEHVLDANYGLFGEIKNKNGAWLIEKPRKKKEIRRYFSVITQLSEKDFLKKMEKNRSKVGSKKAISSGQRVTSKKKEIMVQYLPDSNELVTFKTIKYFQKLEDPQINNIIRRELKAPLYENGNWNLENATYTSYFAKSCGWRREQVEDKSVEISLPINLVKQYTDNLEIGSKFFGKKSHFSKLRHYNLFKYFYDIGFTKTGEVYKKNGVNKKNHHKLLDKILEHIQFGKEKKEIQPHINRKTHFESLKSKIKGDPFKAFLYSHKEHEKVVEEYMEKFDEKMNTTVDLVKKDFRSMGGYLKNMKENKNNLNAHVDSNNYDLDAFQNLVCNLRREDKNTFYSILDWTLFMRNNTLNTYIPTKEELSKFYLKVNHEQMVQAGFVLPALEIPKYQKGLQKILTA